MDLKTYLLSIGVGNVVDGAKTRKATTVIATLYVALALGYGSVKWWRMFNPDQCDAVNSFSCYFIIPFFTFHFTSGVDPYHMNYRFLAGDVIAKAIAAAAALALWANLWRKGNLSWAITSFSLFLSSLKSTATRYRTQHYGHFRHHCIASALDRILCLDVVY
ncbi:Auxin efflux carrier component 5 [Sesamum alatum]|uniref:Auxin efflux carrier component 5 n=1 Tax=Sesamum alatum TaxID=300844 RepID=A0AAE1YN35_9LAMI|nr:Auxin efflux carrier component 5 [Sesamum alatum]